MAAASLSRTKPRNSRRQERLAQRYRVINGHTAGWLVRAGMTWLRTNREMVDSLNVFPVPDGDTGTNMCLTMQAAWDEVSKLPDTSSIAEVIHAVAHGALMGARGNSGVILSQLWRGFSRVLDKNVQMDAPLFARALVEARDTAYRGVVKPVEGTILTVSTDIAAAAEQAVNQGASSTLHILEAIVPAADASVERTQGLNPVLAEAGVVDAGGKGLFFLLEGMLRAARGEPLDEALVSIQPLSELALRSAGEVIEPGQDWEVVIDFRPQGVLKVESFYERLEAMGTSIQVGEGDGIYRMHIHVPDTHEYDPIEYVKSLGEISRLSMENLMQQMREQASAAPEPLKLAAVASGQIAAVAISAGAGLSRVLASLGVAAIVEGGQTMNPSTEEILAAVRGLPTDRIVILPNNKNIILAAQQAAEMSDKLVRVVPTSSIPQGLAALMCLDPAGDLSRVAEEMTTAGAAVKTLEVTRATRSVVLDGVKVKKGQHIGLLDDRLAAAADGLWEATEALLRAAQAEAAELITLYSGEELTPEQAAGLAEQVRSTFPEQEVELIDGGQPHYPLLLSVE
jgi:DAK2 domain fusion protein YloV